MLSTFAFLPIRKSLSYLSQNTSISAAKAQDVLFNVLKQNNMNTNVNFNPAPPSSSVNNSNHIFSAALATGCIVIYFAYAATLSSPSILNISTTTIDGGYTNQDLDMTIDVKSGIAGIKQVYAIDEDGQILYPVFVSNKHYIITIKQNSLYTVVVESNNNNKDIQTYAVANIHKDMPFIKSYEFDTDRITVFVADTLSGINYEKVYGEGQTGNIINPLSINEIDGYVTFDFPKENFRLFLEDKAGNILVNKVEIKKITVE